MDARRLAGSRRHRRAYRAGRSRRGKVGSQLLGHVRLLEGFPKIGPAYRWRRDGRIREILWVSYRIFYRVDDERQQVEILQIWHTSRDEPDLGE